MTYLLTYFHRENLINCKSLERLTIDFEDYYEDSFSILRNFRIASMLGSFSNLKELDIKCDYMEVGIEGFYLDFIDAFTINGFRGLVNLNIQIGMNQVSENMIFNLIEAISKHCLLLKNLILPFEIIKRRKAIVQAAIFGNTWPNLKSIPQHLLQLQSLGGNEVMRYAILDGLSAGSLQFPQLDTLVLRECASIDVARAGLVLPEDMSHIKHLTIIGRALRNPFLMMSENNNTRFSGLEVLDLSGLEFPDCPRISPEVIPHAEFMLLKTEFDDRTRHCKRKLISSIPSAQLQSLKLGLTSFTSDGDSIVGGLDEILKQLKSLEIIGRNPMSWYESQEAFCEQTVPFQLQNGLHQLRDGGELKFFHEDSYDEDPSDDFLQEEDNVTCIQYCLALLQKEYLRNNLLHLKVGRLLEIDWSFIIDYGGIEEVNHVLKELYDDEDDGDNESDDDDKNEDEDDDENKIKKKIFSRTAEVWAKTLSYYKRLKHFEMRNFDITEAGVIEMIDKIALDPPPKLSTVIVRGERNGRNQISQMSRRQQKTIDCWIKPKRIIPIAPLDIVYINDETSLKETLATLNIKRWGLRE